MHPVGVIHVVFAVTAMIAGAAVVGSRKGTRRHRQLGWVYAIAMLGLNLTALAIYRLFGFFGPFHMFALLSLATLGAGLLPARRKLPHRRWLARHYWFMGWSYVGLLAAFAADIAVRLPMVRSAHGPFFAFGTAALVASTIVCTIGAAVMRRQRVATLRAVGG